MRSFYRDKRVLVTGHTGFKGSWLCTILLELGAKVAGYALDPPTKPSLFELLNIESQLVSIRADVRNATRLEQLFSEFQPEIVFHLAAQPLVLEGYRDPVGTYATNVMGTVNVLEACRKATSVQSVVNITTDKVYLNKEEGKLAYQEGDILDGFDPYSNSKSCSELVTQTYRRCFFEAKGTPVSTARAGNVIGGGDFADNRIIPDCVRFSHDYKPIEVRNPHSVRPYQHVLEPLFVYLELAMHQAANPAYAGAYNVGPNEEDCVTTKDLVEMFCGSWDGATWVNAEVPGAPHEAHFLQLDSSKLKESFGWQPTWGIEESLIHTCRWYQGYFSGADPLELTRQDIAAFMQMKGL